MIKSVTSVKLNNKRVLLRVGFDVPLKTNPHHEQPEVVDDTRIKDALKTIRYILDQNAKLIIVSHLDRPQKYESDKSLWPAAVRLSELLNMKLVAVNKDLPEYAVPHIYFLKSDILAHDYSNLSRILKPGSILFLENLRFYPGEDNNDSSLAKILSSYAEVYVNEAFSVAHRKDASTYALAQLLPAYAGISFIKEVSALAKLINNPAKPQVVLMGGAKVTDKVDTINNLVKHANKILLGGIVANTFLKAAGYDIGQSKFADLDLAKQIYRNHKSKLVLPLDVVVLSKDEDLPQSVSVTKIKPNHRIFDLGPKSIAKYTEIIKQGKTLVWNGPFGKIEDKRFMFGSKAMALAFAAKARGPAFGVAGGGETLEVIDETGVSEFIDHVSMGGGAMLEFLSGRKLPAIKMLEK